MQYSQAKGRHELFPKISAPALKKQPTREFGGKPPAASTSISRYIHNMKRLISVMTIIRIKNDAVAILRAHLQGVFFSWYAC
jgi:hypothetical protein